MVLAQFDVDGFEAPLQQWMAAQAGVVESVDTLVCDGKVLRASIAAAVSGIAHCVVRVSLYFKIPAVAIAQSM